MGKDMSDAIQTSAEALESAAIPRAHDVHSDPGQRSTNADHLPKTKPQDAKSPAEWAYERLILYIKNFEEQLDSDEEAAVGFAGGDAGVMRIEGLGYFDPDIVTFYGSDPSGAKTQLVQHVTQLNVMLRAIPRPQDAESPNRIGFRLVADLQDSAS